MSRRSASGPLHLAFDCWQLGLEAWQVMALRSLRLMQGGAAAQAEATRMVSEKWQAGVDLGLAAMTGQVTAPPQVLRHYRRRVAANRRRLARPTRGRR